MNDTLTPMMRQYHEIKASLPGKLIFFRLGDFFEMFFDDAIVAARELEITLTSRNREKNGDPIPMCGVPFHAVDGYVAKLIRKGYKVALCEQLEDPQPGKLVRREVVRVITPGTVTEDVMLDPKDNNFIASLLLRGDSFGAAFLDVSTGDFFLTQQEGAGLAEKLIVEMNHFQPSEVLFPAVNAPLLQDRSLGAAVGQTTLTELENWVYDPAAAGRSLLEHFRTASMDGFGLAGKEAAVCAAGALLRYIHETNKLTLDNITGLQYFQATDFLRLDRETVANLELVRSLDGTHRHTLLKVLDYTATNMGGRLLKNWILRPLMDVAEIVRRQDGVAELAGEYLSRQQLRDCLEPVQDIERLLGKLSSGTARPRDLLALKSSLAPFPRFHQLIARLGSPMFAEFAGRFDPLPDIHALLEQAIAEDPAPTLNEGGFIRDGYHPELDELRAISSGGKNFIAALETRERQRTGISSLKVGYNRVFGYYIEVSKSNLHLVPDGFIRKQTLANAERFITQELKEYEDKVLGAEDQITQLEKELYQEIRTRLMAASARLKASCQIVSACDALASLAEAAVRNRYRRPKIPAGGGIEIHQGRHPVIEHLVDAFVPNDCRLDGDSHQSVILTGPNMGGKSTFLRQVALIQVMGQMGSFVPAEAAELGLVDEIFTRVGASDNLARGRSTFMVEMIETANILNTCTPNSLLLLDEVGRGTATFDGLSIAWSVAEYLHNTSAHRAKTLFATHYHEITRLAEIYPGIQNYSVAVKEGMGEILFLHKVMPGTLNRSYGIEVARLAGMPATVVERSREILKKLERKDIDLTGRRRGKSQEAADLAAEIQKRLF